jgi:hypothetical protein
MNGALTVPPKYPWRIPTDDDLRTMIAPAWKYVRDSLAHTVDYDGWNDQEQKPRRILTGRLGQAWLEWVALHNSINVTPDLTPATMPDVYDLVVGGDRVDVKTSLIEELVGQVAPGHQHRPVALYLFLYCRWPGLTPDWNGTTEPPGLPCLKAYGVQDKEAFWRTARF